MSSPPPTPPTTKQIFDGLIADIQASSNQTIPLLFQSFIQFFCKALAGSVSLLYKYASWMFFQIFVKSAYFPDTQILSKTISPLIEKGNLVGVGLPAPATNAELLIEITVLNEVGSLPNNTQLLGLKNGVTYVTLGGVVLDAALKTSSIRAVSDQSGGTGAGTIGNLEAGDVLTFVSPDPNVEDQVTVIQQQITGANAVSESLYRQRVIDRYQKPPRGGSYSDYEIWSQEVPGIVNVYPYSGDPGQVDVYIESTVASSGNADGIPTVAQLEAVSDAIEFDTGGLASRRPVGSFVNVLPISRQGFDVTVVGLSVDDLATVQSEITTALQEFFLQVAPFIDGLTIPPRTDRITRSILIGLVEDIVTARNGIFDTVRFIEQTQSGSLTQYILGQGEKAKIGTVSFS